MLGSMIAPYSERRLQGPRVMAGIGQGESADVPQHVRVGLEIEAGGRAV
jgi:hypothetical protein